MDLLDRIKLVRCSGPVVAGTADVNGTIIDKRSYKGVIFFADLGDVAATCVLELKAQAAATNSSGAMVDISGATTGTITAGATDCDNKAMLLDVHRSTKGRYTRPVLKRGTANAVVNGIWAILYNGPVAPVALAADELIRVTANPA